MTKKSIALIVLITIINSIYLAHEYHSWKDFLPTTIQMIVIAALMLSLVVYKKIMHKRILVKQFRKHFTPQLIADFSEEELVEFEKGIKEKMVREEFKKVMKEYKGSL